MPGATLVANGPALDPFELAANRPRPIWSASAPSREMTL
jgi:hypothetical protein